MERKLATAECFDAARRIEAFVAAAEDADEMRPLWVRFADVDTADVHYPVSYFCPEDKAFLSTLLLAIPEARRFTLVSSFDFMSRQWPKRKPKMTYGGLSEKPRAVPEFPGFYPPPDPDTLPIKLRFLCCEEAMKEAYTLGENMDRWPFWGRFDHELRSWAHTLVRELDERYPYLAQADVAIGGRLREVLVKLGDHPHQPTFDRRRFWACIRYGAVRHWEQQCDEFLAIMAEGAGDAVRFHEERVEVRDYGRHH